jgi:hypothetical protein
VKLCNPYWAVDLENKSLEWHPSGRLVSEAVRCRKRNVASVVPGQQQLCYSRSQKGTGMSNVKNAARIEAIKKTVEQMNREAVCYITRIPRHALPEGRVLVHNAATPQPKIREHGFRAWTQLKTSRLVQCHCDWAGVDLHGLPHYRVRD